MSQSVSPSLPVSLSHLHCLVLLASLNAVTSRGLGACRCRRGTSGAETSVSVDSGVQRTHVPQRKRNIRTSGTVQLSGLGKKCLAGAQSERREKITHAARTMRIFIKGMGTTRAAFVASKSRGGMRAQRLRLVISTKHTGTKERGTLPF